MNSFAPYHVPESGKTWRQRLNHCVCLPKQNVLLQLCCHLGYSKSLKCHWMSQRKGELWCEQQPVSQIAAHTHRWLWFCRIVPFLEVGDTRSEKSTHKASSHPTPPSSCQFHLSGQSWADRSRGVCFNSPNWDHMTEENPLKWALDFGWLPSSVGPSSRPSSPPTLFSLPSCYSHATPTPRRLGCQELRCMALCRELPPIVLLSSASKNKMFCSLSPPLPPTSPSQPQQHKSLRITVVQELPEAAANSYTLLCLPPSSSDRNLLCPRQLKQLGTCKFSKKQCVLSKIAWYVHRHNHLLHLFLLGWKLELHGL